MCAPLFLLLGFDTMALPPGSIRTDSCRSDGSLGSFGSSVFIDAENHFRIFWRPRNPGDPPGFGNSGQEVLLKIASATAWPLHFDRCKDGDLTADHTLVDGYRAPSDQVTRPVAESSAKRSRLPDDDVAWAEHGVSWPALRDLTLPARSDILPKQSDSRVTSDSQSDLLLHIRFTRHAPRIAAASYRPQRDFRPCLAA